MIIKPKNANVNPTASVKGDMEASVNAVNLEVVDSLSMTATLLNDTEAAQAIMSNMDCTVLVEDKVIMLL